MVAIDCDSALPQKPFEEGFERLNLNHSNHKKNNFLLLNRVGKSLNSPSSLHQEALFEKLKESFSAILVYSNSEAIIEIQSMRSNLESLISLLKLSLIDTFKFHILIIEIIDELKKLLNQSEAYLELGTMIN
jgi:hypothetical protein